MERKEFLSKLGIGVAVVCMGCSLTACGSNPAEEANPDDGSDNPPEGGGGDLMTVNLASEMKNTGDFKTASGIILVRLAQGNDPSSFTAVQVACTHQGVSINYNSAQGKFICPGHGSEFSTSGQVLTGPATTALRHYTVTISNDILTVS